MHVEIKVAQNFVLNFLFNKLPRRRVNLFGEELEAALADKFVDHWYPDKPFKGSAFRYKLTWQLHISSHRNENTTPNVV